MKTKEELTVLKAEMESLNAKLCELTDDELTQVTGGINKTIYVGRAMFESRYYARGDEVKVFIDKEYRG